MNRVYNLILDCSERLGIDRVLVAGNNLLNRLDGLLQTCPFAFRRKEENLLLGRFVSPAIGTTLKQRFGSDLGRVAINGRSIRARRTLTSGGIFDPNGRRS